MYSAGTIARVCSGFVITKFEKMIYTFVTCTLFGTIFFKNLTQRYLRTCTCSIYYRTCKFKRLTEEQNKMFIDWIRNRSSSYLQH